MLRGNINIIRNLPEMLGCTQGDFCRRIGIDTKKFTKWTTANGEGFNPQVVEFVNLCNKIHLPPCLFIQSDMDYMRVPDMKELFPPGREWKAVRFDHQAFISHFGLRGPLRLPAKMMMKKLGKSDVTWREGWKKPGEACTLRLSDLFLFCEEFNLDINKFLIDPQGKIYSEVVHDNQDEVVKKLRQRERRIRELNKELEAIKEELALERHARMTAERKVGKLTEELAANNWNFDRLMAAEDATKTTVV